MTIQPHATGYPTILQCLATLGDSEVRELLINAGISPDCSCANCNQNEVAKIMGTLVLAQSSRTLASLLPNLACESETILPTIILSVRARNVLADNGISTVHNFSFYTLEELGHLKNSGLTTVLEYSRLAVRLQLHVAAKIVNPNDSIGSPVLGTTPREQVGSLPGNHSTIRPTLLQCFSCLGILAVKNALFEAGINPQTSVADYSQNDLAKILYPLVLKQSNLSFGTLLPGLMHGGNKNLPTAALKTRARNILSNYGIETISRFASLTTDHLRASCGAGQVTLVEYASLAICLHVQLVDGVCDGAQLPIEPTPLDAALGKLTELASWAVNTGKIGTLGELFALRPNQDTLPPDVASALTDFNSIDITPLSIPAAKVESAVNDVFHQLEERKRDIFSERQLNCNGSTLQQLADKYGITRERVRQIEDKTCEFLRTALASVAHNSLRWRAHALELSVRNGLPETSDLLVDARDQAFLGFSSVSLTRDLLLWLAGPYLRLNGWLLRKGSTIPVVPIGEPPFSQRDIVLQSDVSHWLSTEGFRPELAETVMRHSALKLLDDTWIRWVGFRQDKAAILLGLLDRPADAEELCKLIGEGVSEDGLRCALQTDPRFIRVNKKDFELRSWGGEQYSNISDEMASRIERTGGAVVLSDLIDELVQTFNVKANSVRMYATSPRFVLSGGMVRLRMDNEHILPDTNIGAVKGLFLEKSRNRVHLIITVDEETERGSGMWIRPAVGYALGLTPKGQLNFESEDGARLKVTWPESATTGPTIGSSRALATKTGTRLGETMVITFELDTKRVRAQRVPPDTTDIHLLTGLEIMAGKELEIIGAALGCDRTEVRSVLSKRGDVQLLNALPQTASGDGMAAALKALETAMREP